jgi:cytochrome b561
MSAAPNLPLAPSPEAAATASNDRWPKAVAALHWVAGLVILGLVGVGLVMTDLEPADPLRRNLGRVHSISGNVLALLTLARLALVRRGPRPAPMALSAAHQAGVTAVHVLLYALPLAVVATGLATGLRSDWHPYLKGDLPVPPDFSGLRSREVHEVLALSLAALAGVHVAGAVLSQLRGGQALRRIVPFLR